LEFKLRLQEFVELIRADNYTEALNYSREHFSKFGNEQLANISQAMILLAIKPDFRHLFPQYKFLFEEHRWVELMHLYVLDSYRLHSLTKQSLLELNLQVGLAVLKTVFCYDKESHNENCPTCHDDLNKLAQPLPFSPHVHTSLVCKITGEVMDYNNPPLFLPNGNIYGEKVLNKMANENGGKVTCPETKQIFNISELRKVFIS